MWIPEFQATKTAPPPESHLLTRQLSIFKSEDESFMREQLLAWYAHSTISVPSIRHPDDSA